MADYFLAECSISAIFNSGAGLFRYTLPEANKMTQPTTRHTATEIALPLLTVRASYWPDEDGGPIHSVFNVTSGAAHVQTDISEEQLRELASMLTYHANQLKEAKAARESLADADADLEDRAASQGFGLVIPRA